MERAGALAEAAAAQQGPSAGDGAGASRQVWARNG